MSEQPWASLHFEELYMDMVHVKIDFYVTLTHTHTWNNAELIDWDVLIIHLYKYKQHAVCIHIRKYKPLAEKGKNQIKALHSRRCSRWGASYLKCQWCFSHDLEGDTKIERTAAKRELFKYWIIRFYGRCNYRSKNFNHKWNKMARKNDHSSRCR